MNNLSICKNLIKEIIKENNDRYVNTEEWRDYALASNVTDESIEVWAVTSKQLYSSGRIINAAIGCRCNWFLSIHTDSDGNVHSSIYIF